MKPNAALQLLRLLRRALAPARPAVLSASHQSPGDREKRLRVALTTRRRGRAPLPWTEHPLFKGKPNG